MEKTSLKHRIAVALVVLICCLSVACSKGKSVSDLVSLDSGEVPLVHSEDVSALISDSGVTRYRLVADIWDVYNREQDSYWHFPKGIYVEKFDSLFKIEGSIESDTAYYYDKKTLWRLVGNVRVVNLQHEKFETEELFWDESKRLIFSDKDTKIEQKDKTIYCKGFESNQTMTDYDMFKVYAILYVDEKSQPDSLGIQ